jgi:hypothetical protein
MSKTWDLGLGIWLVMFLGVVAPASQTIAREILDSTSVVAFYVLCATCNVRCVACTKSCGM